MDVKRRILNDVGIRKALDEKEIILRTEITDDQIQPASLDVRVGKVILYDVPWCSYYRSIMFTDQKDQIIDLFPGCSAELFFHEKISYDQDKYDLKVDFRSSRGKMMLRLDSTDVTVKEDELSISLRNNNPNTVRLYGQDKFAQLFFCPKQENENSGYLVTDELEAKELADLICSGRDLCESYLIFRLGDHILKYRSDLGIVDSRRKYSEEELFEHYSTDQDFLFKPADTIIVQTHPKLTLPSDIGIQVLHSLPDHLKSGFDLEGHCINAGWVDPGYRGFITAHPYQEEKEVILKKRMPLELGQIVKFDSPSERPYGSEELKSHYQGSEGRGPRS